MKKMFYSLTSLALFVPALAFGQGYDPTRSEPTGVATETDANQIILDIINYVLGFLAALAILVIVIAGILYITASGDEDRVDNAKKWLLYAIIGLVIALLGYVIVSVVSTMVGAG